MANLTLPISVISLCSVPITPLNQLDFNSQAEQVQYFIGKRKFQSDISKYQPRSGVMRVKGYVEDFRNINYGFYTNNFEGQSHIYYFWVVKKDYIAANVTELTIQIDVYQTWQFQLSFADCMIERGHVDNDTIGRHTIPEDFELGDYVVRVEKEVNELKKVCFFVAVVDELAQNWGGMQGGIYSGFSTYFFKKEDINLLTQFIQGYADRGKADAIGYIYSYPLDMLHSSVKNLPSGSRVSTSDLSQVSLNISDILKKDFGFRGNVYTPYNNKLLTYPFNTLAISNASGGNIVLKFELFNNGMDIVMFMVESTISPNPKIVISPILYNNKNNPLDDSLEMQGFGLCSWNNDNYANWYAQNQNTINAQSVNAFNSYRGTNTAANNSFYTANKNADIAQTSGALGALGTIGLGVGNAIGGLNVGGAIGSGIQGAIQLTQNELARAQAQYSANSDLANAQLLNAVNYQNTMKSIMASVHDAAIQPNTGKGDTSANGLDVARGTNTFYIRQMMIRPEYAKRIDMYFQMFGYQLSEIANPENYLSTRQKWNYIKTVGCQVKSNIPMEDKIAIEQMFDTGFTIWHGENYMGRYNTENTIS